MFSKGFEIIPIETSFCGEVMLCSTHLCIHSHEYVCSHKL